MTRRLLAAALLAALAGSGVAATSASAHEDESIICIGGDNQRKPGYYQGICIDRLINIGNER